MSSATTERNATDIVFSNEGSWSSFIATLRSNFVVGNTIQASHLSFLRDRMNEMLGHYHSYSDLAQAGTYGAPYGDDTRDGRAPDYTNVGQGIDYFVSGGKNTSRSEQFSADVSTTYSIGAVVTAAQHNELALRSRQMISHTHPIVDTISL